MLIHSYAERQLSDRLLWKKGGHAIDCIARRFTDRGAGHDCELYFSPEEDDRVEMLLGKAGLTTPFIVVEPDTNRDWFGELRAWPIECWQELVDRLRVACPDVAIVQLGLDGAPKLDGTVDLCGRTDFREAALILRKSNLFVGTDGGLMHAANAVGARAVIMWGGVILPEFASYPERHTVLCKYVSCAPCGQFGWCDNEHVCMRSITTDAVFAGVIKALDTDRPATPASA